MSLQAVFLVLLSALAHSLWNLTSKKRSATLSFFWLAALWSGVVSLPYLLWHTSVLLSIGKELWGWLLLTGLFQVVYIWGLVLAYERGQMSVLYPLIRALPLVFLLLVSAFFGQLPSQGAIIGILLVTLGSLLLPLQHFKDWHWRHYVNLAMLFVLMAALGTLGYSWIDASASKSLHQLAPHLGQARVAILYVLLQNYSALMLMLLPLAWQKWRRPERELIWHPSAGHRSALLTGSLILLTYALVVWAMTLSDNVSLVVALRQFSILFSLCFGIWLLKEQQSRPKWLGTGLILLGLVLVILFRH